MKVGQSVIINKPNHISHGLGGDIVSINEETKRIRVDLGFGGEWGFNYNEVQSIEAQNKAIEAIKTESMGIVSSENKTSVKRAYSKRSEKPKEVKQKRKYERKKVD